MDPVRGVHDNAAVALNDRAGRQVQVTPPFDVGHVAERTAHGDAGALVFLGGRVGEHGNLHVEQRRGDHLAEIRLVPLVIRVRDERHAGRQQLGTGGLDVDRLAGLLEAERNAMVEARVFARFELGLGHGGLERDVPQARGILLVGLTAFQIAQECLLGHALRVLANGVIGLFPIDRQAQLTPEFLELLLILRSELLAQFNEILARDRHLVLGLDLLALGALERRHEIRVVLERSVDAHTVVVLHTALGGQAVVVPTHRVEHLIAVHALEPGDDVGVRVREHVTDVQVPRDGGWRGVDGIDGLALAWIVERARAILIPDLAPLGFKAVHAHTVGECGEIGVDRIIFAICHRKKSKKLR